MTATVEPDRVRQGYAWGLFLLVLGLTWGIPLLPEGLAGVAVGLILLGLNGARYLGRDGHPTSTFTLALGCIAVFVGLGAAAVDYADLYLPVPPVPFRVVVPLLLAGLGLALGLRAWRCR